MTGLEGLQRISDSGMKVPVIILTAHDAPGAEHRCLNAGAAAHLRKPLDGAVLLAAIERATGAAAKPAS